MENLFITPMNMPQGIGSITGDAISSRRVFEGGESLFQGIFENAIQNVRESEMDLAQKQYLLATGQIDDAHTVPIAAAETQLAVDLLVQLRNKALEAYNSLINIGI